MFVKGIQSKAAGTAQRKYPKIINGRNPDPNPTCELASLFLFSIWSHTVWPTFPRPYAPHNRQAPLCRYGIYFNCAAFALPLAIGGGAKHSLGGLQFHHCGPGLDMRKVSELGRAGVSPLIYPPLVLDLGVGIPANLHGIPVPSSPCFTSHLWISSCCFFPPKVPHSSFFIYTEMGFEKQPPPLPPCLIKRRQYVELCHGHATGSHVC